MPSAFDVVVRTDRLTKSYGRLVALCDVDLRIERGEVFGYLGPNGAGKSTTLRLLMGMLRPTAGAAELFGIDAWSAAVAVHRRVGYVPGELAQYPRMTGRQHIDYVQHLRGDRDRKHGDTLASRLDLQLDKPVRALSKGNRQKLALVLALMSRPDLLILDEPTGGLDPLVQLEFHSILREHTARGGTVLLSSHVLSEVQRIADRVGVLREGHLVAVEKLEDLQEKSLHHVVAKFVDSVDAADFQHLDGLRDIAVDGTTLRCSATQSALDTLIKHVGRYTLVDFECAEASLDETFIALYGSGNS
ncbi:ABC transporter ATP-binding protein [Rhodococcus qingshengii]|uniref:ABC transporter ATP-binding protein n=1 Tax=Rhodococcus qingshengii TaxID=334542 RepID=UPI001C23B08C|nr:ABC transporter ATP-binding protein [Rhodococcus qingshengii]QXC46514.1 ABC transporter ATP-binding protein [Rhodococcus qingshengii]